MKITLIYYFVEMQNVTFKGNHASSQGAVVNSCHSSSVKFDGNTSVTYEGNRAGGRGGTVVSGDNCSLIYIS